MARTKKIADNTATMESTTTEVLARAIEVLSENKPETPEQRLERERKKIVRINERMTKTQSNLAFLQSDTRTVFVNIRNGNSVVKKEILARDYKNGAGQLNVILRKEIPPITTNNADGTKTVTTHQTKDIVTFSPLSYMFGVQTKFIETDEYGNKIIDIQSPIEAFFIQRYLTLERFKYIYSAFLPDINTYINKQKYHDDIFQKWQYKVTVHVGSGSFTASDILHYPFYSDVPKEDEDGNVYYEPLQFASEEELKGLCPEHLKELLNL